MPKTANLSFKGTAVYVNAILAQTTAGGVQGNSDITFLLDNQASYFLRNALTSNTKTAQTIFLATNLADQDHTLHIINGRSNSSFAQMVMLLDSIIYTTTSLQDDDIPGSQAGNDDQRSRTPSKSSVPIIAAICSAVGGIILGLLAFWLYLRARARKIQIPQSPPPPPNNLQASSTQRIVPFLAYKSPLPPDRSEPFDVRGGDMESIGGPSCINGKTVVTAIQFIITVPACADVPSPHNHVQFNVQLLLHHDGSEYRSMVYVRKGKAQLTRTDAYFNLGYYFSRSQVSASSRLPGGPYDQRQPLARHWKRSTYDQAETLDKPKVASFSFKGTAVYVNAILGEVTAAGVKGNSDVTFLLDDSVSYFLHNATSPTLHTIFSMTDLSNQNHTLTIVNGHPGGSFPQVMLFLDSIIYTTESSEEDVSTSPSPDARDADASSKPTRSDILIIIAISVGVGGIILGIFAYRLYLRCIGLFRS
ncbi:hypothetical protein EYR36_006966 [Pleurotus pulmonarius]|nr:hypothetical protein EYR36_006966 [Pleurotus pulmonarius]